MKKNYGFMEWETGWMPGKENAAFFMQPGRAGMVSSVSISPFLPRYIPPVQLHTHLHWSPQEWWKNRWEERGEDTFQTFQDLSFLGGSRVEWEARKARGETPALLFSRSVASWLRHELTCILVYSSVKWVCASLLTMWSPQSMLVYLTSSLYSNQAQFSEYVIKFTIIFKKGFIEYGWNFKYLY